MFVHNVYFWLKDGITAEEEAAFAKGVKTLLTISTIKHGWVGKPAKTNRPVIERSYTYALVTVFENEAGHDVYQVDPIHKVFLETCAQYWKQVRIFDSED
jgi:Stress responsive A/B Barrel Domain